MTLTLGIVGLPNVGKSTLFNALTKADVLAANYPFATIEPNVGVVPLPDPRLDKLAQVFSSVKIVPAVVSFVDIAGIVKGASEGAGLGNKFLANIREADAICQVVRVFADDDVVHVDGRVDPMADIETINTELILADMQTLEKAVPRLEKEARTNKDRKPVLEAAQQAQVILDGGATLFSAQRKLDLSLLRELSLMTAKPFLYVFNADESVLTDEARRAELRAAVAPADAVFLDAKVEYELLELDDESALELLESVGQDEPGLHALARAGFHTLGLQTYLTAGLKESRRLDDPPGVDGAAGGRGDPHRLREGLHQGRGDLVRRPGRRRVGRRRPLRREGPDRGQGLCHARRGCRGVPLQRVISRIPIGLARAPARGVSRYISLHPCCDTRVIPSLYGDDSAID